MRGWHNESLRHSLAARGIRTKYLYHGTVRENIPMIRRRGILHNPPTRRFNASEDYIYLSPKPHQASYWVWAADMMEDEKNIIVLRVPIRVLDRRMLREEKGVDEVDEVYDEWTYNRNILPEDIEIFSKGKWRSLK